MNAVRFKQKQMRPYTAKCHGRKKSREELDIRTPTAVKPADESMFGELFEQQREFALTFQAACPPQARVGHHLLVLLAGLVLAHGLAPADAAGVQPVVRADRDGHEAEGREGSHRGQQHLDSAVEQTHVSAFHERGTPFPLDVQEVNI